MLIAISLYAVVVLIILLFALSYLWEFKVYERNRKIVMWLRWNRLIFDPGARVLTFESKGQKEEIPFDNIKSIQLDRAKRWKPPQEPFLYYYYTESYTCKVVVVTKDKERYGIAHLQGTTQETLKEQFKSVLEQMQLQCELNLVSDFFPVEAFVPNEENNIIE